MTQENVSRAWEQRLLRWSVAPHPASAGRAFAVWGCMAEALDAADPGHLFCIQAMPVHLYEHQRRAVARVVGPLSGRALLADEVGMGKTVEAGAILKELMLRGRVARALILVPAALVRQWHAELRQHCHVHPCLHPHPAHGWDRAEVVLAPLETARLEPHAQAIAASPWDLVIVDEAHRLKRRGSAGFRLIATLRKRALVLVSATPVHNDLGELFNLVSLLRPGQLGTPRAFRHEFTLGPRLPRDPVRLRRLVHEVMVRTRRIDAGIVLPERRVEHVATPFSPDERELYEELLVLLRAVAAHDHRLHAARAPGHGPSGGRSQQDGSGRAALIGGMILRELTSSPGAVASTLGRLARQPPSLAWQRHVHDVERLARGAGRLARADPGCKIRWLVAFAAREHLPPGSVVAFTQFLATATEAAGRLQAAGVRAELFTGTMTGDERERALRAFRQETPVLVSTDAGSEGHNLQFARMVVHLDLPWNPMRVEQRIGRVHRLGQTRRVEAVHLAVPGTIEEYLLALIYEKLGMFREVVGDLDEVVAAVPGGLERRIRDIALGLESGGDPRRGMEHLGSFLEQQWRRWRQAQALTHAFLDDDGRDGEKAADEDPARRALA